MMSCIPVPVSTCALAFMQQKGYAISAHIELERNHSHQIALIWRMFRDCFGPMAMLDTTGGRQGMKMDRQVACVSLK